MIAPLREEQERQLALLVRFEGNGWATQDPQTAANRAVSETAESVD
jgi:hypothetical protein